MRLLRFFRILKVVAKHRLDRNLPPEHTPAWLLVLLLPLRLIPARGHTPAESARLALEELGPIFIKFGQLLSTRRDLFTEETASELCRLQDQVPPFAPEEATRIIETTLGAPVDEIFSRFNATPMASASVAQVHEATLGEGLKAREVVVKVIRPGIRAVIEQDLKLMYLAAGWLQRFWPVPLRSICSSTPCG